MVLSRGQGRLSIVGGYGYGDGVDFTVLHRLLGRSPEPLTSQMLDEAIAAGVRETDDLDWKRQLIPADKLTTGEFPKDVAAMANSGGGMLVYGVEESQKAATGRVDVADVTESYERSLRQSVISAVQPPIFGLRIHRLGDAGSRALVVEVPASVDGPHLVYRGEYFGAPIRNDADTVWMRERQIAEAYRARFNERRNAHEALDVLYAEALAGHDVTTRAWAVGVARRRVPSAEATRLDRETARADFQKAQRLSLTYTDHNGTHPFDDVDVFENRPGLRRRVFRPRQLEERSAWREAWATIHDDGSCTLAAAMGGRQVSSTEAAGPNQVEAARLERFVGALLALVQVSAERRGWGDYETKVGLEWAGESRILMGTFVEQIGFTFTDGSIPLARFTPIRTTISCSGDDQNYRTQVHDLALDAINQGGIQHLRSVRSHSAAGEPS